MFKAAIFDMDGTMIDTEALHSLAYEKVLKEFGVTPIKNEHGTVHVSGATTPETWEILKKRHGFEADTTVLTEKKRQAMITLSGDVELLPGVLALLEDLRAHQIQLAIGSSAQRARLTLVLEKLGIADYFSAMVSGDEVAKGKPAPDIYLATARKLGVNPKDCVVLEDAARGVQSAVAAGMKVVAVPNRYTARMDFSSADIVKDSLIGVNYAAISRLF